MSAQDLNQHRRQREELKSNQSNQRRRVDETAAKEDNNNNSSSGSSFNEENVDRKEILEHQAFLLMDRQYKEDAIHDSDDDDNVEEASSVSDEGWSSNSQDDQNQQGTAIPVTGHYQIENEDGFFSETLRWLNRNVGLSYEELTELAERKGKVQRGLSKETISRELKTRVHTRSVDSRGECVICTICQDGYYNKDKIATLDCQHEYHEDCITQWLLQKNLCPYCNGQALESKKKC
ncbi:hypothetical protein MKW92_027258 [Papaver armeniacum]|nr:hypothetical protein MKW92_027258 [Papaver armeniacum]